MTCTKDVLPFHEVNNTQLTTKDSNQGGRPKNNIN